MFDPAINVCSLTWKQQARHSFHSHQYTSAPSGPSRDAKLFLSRAVSMRLHADIHLSPNLIVWIRDATRTNSSDTFGYKNSDNARVHVLFLKYTNYLPVGRICTQAVIIPTQYKCSSLYLHARGTKEKFPQLQEKLHVEGGD